MRRWNPGGAPLLAAILFSVALGCQSNKTTKTEANGDIAVRVTKEGFEPSRILVKKGQNATLVFTRETEETCANEVVIAGNGPTVKLPLHEPIRVALGTVNTTIPFTCGMKMLTGEVVAQ